MTVTTTPSYLQNSTPVTSTVVSGLISSTSTTAPISSVLKEISINPIISTSKSENIPENIENLNSSSLSFDLNTPTSSLIASNNQRRPSEWYCITVQGCSTIR